MYSDTETKWLSEEPVEAADTDLEEIESDSKLRSWRNRSRKTNQRRNLRKDRDPTIRFSPTCAK